MTDYSYSYQIIYDEAARSCCLRFRCFDTPNSVTLFGCDAPDYAAEDLLRDVHRRCLDFHRIWSFSMGESDIARVNAAGERASVDRRTAQILQAMKEFHDSEPAFDFTVGPVSLAWKVAERVPSDDELARALSHVGASKVEVSGCEIAKADPLVQVDIGGAAKGFVTDDIARFLRDSGVTCADIDLGGNLFMMGSHPAGRPWRVSIRVPEGVDAKLPIIEVSDKSVVTSGSYERFVEIDGKRYQHIIDARTGWPSESDIVSATVVSNSSLLADMLATTTLLLGSDGFEALVARHADCEFVAVTTAGKVLRSKSVAVVG